MQTVAPIPKPTEMDNFEWRGWWFKKKKKNVFHHSLCFILFLCFIDICVVSQFVFHPFLCFITICVNPYSCFFTICMYVGRELKVTFHKQNSLEPSDLWISKRARCILLPLLQHDASINNYPPSLATILVYCFLHQTQKILTNNKVRGD